MLRFFLPDLMSRNLTEQELMDRSDADPELLRRTVRQFRWINALFSSSRRLLRTHVFSIMQQNPFRTYSLLDVGAGGCDIAQWIAREARRRHLKIQITALDNDPRMLPVAYETIEDFPEIQIIEGNALDLGSLGPFDFIFSNHFLHHLSWEEIRLFLLSVIAQTRLAFVMNDLKRSRGAYLGATLSLGLLARHSFAFYDGRLSIRRGFLPDELKVFLHTHFPDAPIEVVETSPARVVLVSHFGGEGCGQESKGKKSG
ncbi:methyltransferase domain-containing protein [Geoalkalibacter halelectricus]|uniref:Methyltransferase domain-containing protein n=1 Tax=Geoalkalibacter halelectricus TaxID=2847045 RepID=A0ABY5ZGI4_9BACT|nr:methyltransferase domain-containing protein [Geoalkalibacter halelectricus]MDO3380141.1 methyltransferase domain-containing protein [Geoalkalibacter halelectricus]UWZ78285.1 methyltransferase domain-containing protein [Geoalkalibacter halelectricus]